MADYKSYLAASILTEDKLVTYRLLSRVLKVHVNAAKEMLFDFHNHQNAKKPGTIHATYLVSGTKRKETAPAITNGGAKDGEDDYMQSSPFMSSSMPQPEEGTGETSVLSISLVREEELEGRRAEYDQITSIHIYSLGPHPLKNLQILSDVTREIQLLTTSEDPLETATQYGSITNPNTKRRAARRPPPAPVSAPVAVKTKPADPPKSVKEEPKSQPATANDFFGKSKAKAKPTSKAPSKESTPNPPTLKKETSSLFKSFAQAKPKKKAAEETESQSPAEDLSMKDVDDDDDEEEIYVPPAPSKEIVDADRKSRKEREARLKLMMEEDDDEEEVATPAVEKEEEVIPEPEVKAKVEEKEEPPVVSGGRRRGRRRVMKKKTVKDAEGYLVTKEEQAWESYSEDEPAPPKPKMQTSTTTAKGKKTAAKGQGSIMSFFGKK